MDPITVPVSVPGPFCGWIFRYAGEMNILKPGYVKDTCADCLQEAIDDVPET